MPLLVVLASQARAADVAEPLEFEPPREVGYLLGDVIVHRFGLRVHAPWTLDEDVLPEAGRVTRWLQRAPAELRGHWRPGGRYYELVLRYQIVRSVPRVIGMATPPVVLTLRNTENNDELLPIVQPAWGFETSPISPELEERPQGQLPALRPVQLPPPVDQRWRRLRLLALGGAILVLAAWLADRHGWLPRRKGEARPFADALRTLARGEAEDAAAARVVAVHKAFNSTAGYAVFASNLPQFFDDHRGYTPARRQASAFFEASEQHLFRAVDERMADGAIGEQGVRRLLRACRACERVAPAVSKRKRPSSRPASAV